MPILSAQIVIPCSQFDATFAALTGQLGFRVEMISPADAPTTAVVSGFGVTLRLESTPQRKIEKPVLRLMADQSLSSITVPDICIEWGRRDAAIQMPTAKQEFIITRNATDETWITGRAGMQYRDLIPGRFGGRFIASHIRISGGGPVPDYVHFHDIRFQMIFCKAGWVRVVYEDQGEPFVMHAGDCVLQPPQIRHRVLEASAGLEVIELGCPAIHDTHADHDLLLPAPQVRAMREFGGQRFVRHIAAESRWMPWTWMGQDTAGFEAQDSGINAATHALAAARVVRAGRAASTLRASHDGELLFLFLLKGALHLRIESLGDHTLHADDSATIPPGVNVSLHAETGAEFLEVSLPAA